MTARKSGFIVGAIAGAGVAVRGSGRCGHAHGDGGRRRGPVIRASMAGAPAFAPPPGAPMSFADIFEKVSPAVVQINVTSKASAAGAAHPGPGRLRHRAARPEEAGSTGQKDQDGEDGDTPATPKQQSAGSGFFISADGYIVTNNHVVADADDIQVVMKDGRELKATLVGRDEGTDLAVIKVVDPKAKGADFPYVNFENQAKPRVGDWVITIGNPFGLGGTATAGIISAYNRDLQDSPRRS
jgi:serine protease Do